MRDRLKLNFLPLVAAAVFLFAALPGHAQFAASAPAAATPAAKPASGPRGRVQAQAADYIVAVVNDESVTANELQQQIDRKSVV